MHGNRGRRALEAGLVAMVGLLLAVGTAACSDDGDDRSLTVYSGRGEELVGPLLAQFEDDTGIDLEIRYGGTAELAALILEEEDRSPADVYFGQDAGALGALEAEEAFHTLPAELLERVDPTFRSRTGAWVGVSGRARVVAYSTERVSADALPTSVFALTDSIWQGRVGWAPTNGSFQSFVTAMRELHGDDVTAQWLRDMLANEVQEYPNNSSQIQAIADGEIDLGLVNHYYLWRFRAENPSIPVENLYTDPGGAGALINVAGVGIVGTSDHPELAEQFVDYLLSAPAQDYFASAQEDDGFEYPLIAGVMANVALPPLAELNPPDLDLTSLADLQGTLDLLREAGALP
jgi:iron(III) transport system substrate-binding protein